MHSTGELSIEGPPCSVRAARGVTGTPGAAHQLVLLQRVGAHPSPGAPRRTTAAPSSSGGAPAPAPRGCAHPQRPGALSSGRKPNNDAAFEHSLTRHTLRTQHEGLFSPPVLPILYGAWGPASPARVCHVCPRRFPGLLPWFASLLCFPGLLPWVREPNARAPPHPTPTQPRPNGPQEINP